MGYRASPVKVIPTSYKTMYYLILTLSAPEEITHV